MEIMNFIASTPGLPEHALKGGMETVAFVAQREWVSISGQAVSVPGPERYVHKVFLLNVQASTEDRTWTGPLSGARA
jgi:hypothetical protein